MAEGEVARWLEHLRCLLKDHEQGEFVVKSGELKLDLILQGKLKNLRMCQPAEYTDACKIVNDFFQDLDTNNCSQCSNDGQKRSAPSGRELEVYAKDPRKLFVIICLKIMLQIHKWDSKALVELEQSKEQNMPLIVLGANDKKLITTALQLVACLGIYLHLKPGVCLPCSDRSHFWTLLEDAKKETSIDEAFLLLNVKSMCSLVKNREFGQLIVNKSLSEIFGALIQIGFKAKPMSGKGLEVKVNDDTDEREQSFMYSLCRHQRDWCKFQLQGLLASVYQPLVMRNLLILQGFRNSRQADKKSSANPKWLQRICSKLLSQRLMEKNGLQNMLCAVFEEHSVGNEGVKLIDAIGYLVSSCPYQANSLEEYYENIGHQVLGLLDMQETSEQANTLYSKVAVNCISWMLKKDVGLTKKFVFIPLMKPLYRMACRKKDFLRDEVVVSARELNVLIKKIHQISTHSRGSEAGLVDVISKASQPLFEIYCFLGSGISHLRSQLNEILVWLLRFSTNEDTREMLFFFLLGEAVQLSHKQDRIAVSPTCLKFRQDSAGSLWIVSKTDSDVEDSCEATSSSSTEQRVIAILSLLSSFQDSVIPEDFFVFLLGKLNDTLNEKKAPAKGEELLALDGVISDLKYHIPLVSMIASICDKFGDNVLQNPTPTLSFIKTSMECCLNAANSSDGAAEFDLPTGRRSETLEMAVMILSLIVNSAAETNEFEGLMEFVDVLDKIEKSSSAEQIRQAANRMRVCILTRGSVTSEPQHESKFHEGPGQQQGDRGFTKDEYDIAMKELSDPLVSTRGHAIIRLTSMLVRGDDKALRNAEKLMCMFFENLSHEDSFVYLASVRGLAALARSHHNIVIPLLAKEFAMFSSKDTSENMNVTSDSKERLCLSTENRLKIGEAMTKALASCGPTIASYSQTVLAALLTGMKDEDGDVRASSLSNVGDLCKLLGFAINPVIQELLNCISSVLKFDKDLKVKTAAVRVLKLLLDGCGRDISPVLSTVMRDIYRTLKSVINTETDEVVLGSAHDALLHLESIMKEVLFPNQSFKKQIRVLRH